MNELNKKLTEWADLVYIGDAFESHPITGEYTTKAYFWKEDNTRITSTLTHIGFYVGFPDFPNDLAACFRHLEPELYRRGYRYQLSRLQDGHMVQIFKPTKAWAEIVAVASDEKPAAAFCKAVEQLMEKQ